MAAVYDDMTRAKLMQDNLAYPVLQIHDELLFECHDSVRDDLAELVKWRFETCCTLKVPIKAGAAHAQTWGSIPK